MKTAQLTEHHAELLLELLEAAVRKTDHLSLSEQVGDEDQDNGTEQDRYDAIRSLIEQLSND